MDQIHLVLGLVMGHLPNKCKDSGRWACYHQCAYRLGERTRLQGNGETHPRTLLALERLQEQHLEEELVLELQEHHLYRRTDKLRWLLSHPHCCKRPLEALGLGPELDPKKAMEPEPVRMATHVSQAPLSNLQGKYQPMQDSLAPILCGKQLQGQVPAR